MKTLLKISVLALSLLGFSQGASAAVLTSSHNLGLLNSYDSKEFGSNFAANTSFDDSWFFTLTGQSDAFSAINASFSRPALQNFTAFSAELLDSASNQVANYLPAYSIGGKLLSGAIDVASLAAGTYSIHVTGTTANTFSTAYAGTLSVSPVPEAEEWAMMLVGLGLVGVQLLRKSDGENSSIMYG